MQEINVSLLQPGMIVGDTVYSSMGEIFLKKGVVLTSRYIQRLLKTGIPMISIENNILGEIDVDETISTETKVAAIQQVKNILLQTKESGKLVIDPSALYGTVGGFTDSLLGNKSLMVNLVDLRTQDDYTFVHSVNVCVLSLMTGITLGYPREYLQLLGVGALLHDLGKVKIPEPILNKPARLTPDEYTIMQKHTIYGFELIIQSKDLGEEHALIALQHHESYDGTGYPLGISGKNFHELAQIVAIADKFDALTANRIYRKAFPSHEAYEMCAATGNYLFKDPITKAFLHNIAAYPSGSLVELNNNQVAVVVNTPKGFSRFPKVRVLFDQHHRPLPLQKEISLKDEIGISVVRVLEDADIQKLLHS